MQSTTPKANNQPPDSHGELLSAELLARLERMELISRKIFRGRMKGERRSKRKGQSVEFADFRNYVAGDDLRFIDWNLYARLDRLYLKIFLEEEDLHVFSMIDTSPSMNFGEPTKLRVAKQISAALSFVGLCRGDRVKVLSTDGSDIAGGALRGRSSLPRLLAGYRNFVPRSNSPTLSQSVKNFCMTNTGKGIFILITDLMEKSGYEEALRMLVAREMDVYVIHLLSPEELSPSLEGDLKLVDCEDGDQREISVSSHLLKRYQQTLDAFIGDAKAFCNRRSIAYIPARSDQAVDILINQYLRQRGLVR
jgi:uncharacterized protein (DUF58 family)